MRLIAVLTLATCLAAVPGTAAERPSQDVPAARDSVTEAPQKRVVCEKITRVGSRIPQRVCRSENQIRAEREDARAWTSHKQDEAARSGGLPPDVAGPG